MYFEASITFIDFTRISFFSFKVFAPYEHEMHQISCTFKNWSFEKPDLEFQL